MQHILGNSILNTVSTTESNNNWNTAWELDEFEVVLSPDILYQKLEAAE